MNSRFVVFMFDPRRRGFSFQVYKSGKKITLNFAIISPITCIDYSLEFTGNILPTADSVANLLRD